MQSEKSVRSGKRVKMLHIGANSEVLWVFVALLSLCPAPCCNTSAFCLTAESVQGRLDGALSNAIYWKVFLSIEGRLELNDLYGLTQLTAFYNPLGYILTWLL